MWGLIWLIVLLTFFLIVFIWLTYVENEASNRLSELFRETYRSYIELKIISEKAINVLEELNKAYIKVSKENIELKRKLEKYVDNAR